LSYQYAYRHYSGEIEWAVNDVEILEEINIFFAGDEHLVIYRQDYYPFLGKEIVAVQINILGDDSEIIIDFGGADVIWETGGWDPRVFDGEGYYWHDYGPELSSVVRITEENEARIWEGDYYILTEADLESLSGYTSVTGTLFINYPTLISLEGLECLTQVGGNLEIYENDSLISFEGVDKLKYVGGNMRIYDNDSLISLEGLEKLKYVGGHMRIRDNDSLTSLEGVDKLKSVGSELEINNNDELCTSLAEALRDQLLDGGGIGGLITILDNNDC